MYEFYSVMDYFYSNLYVYLFIGFYIGEFAAMCAPARPNVRGMRDRGRDPCAPNATPVPNRLPRSGGP